MVNYILSKSPNGLFLIFERSVQFDFTIRQNNILLLKLLFYFLKSIATIYLLSYSQIHIITIQFTVSSAIPT